MASFFDDLKRTVNNLAQSTVDKTKELTDIAKLKLANSNEEEKIKGAYIELGKKYYDEHKDTATDHLKDLCDTITDAYKIIEENNAKIQKLKGSCVCPICGSAIFNGEEFCKSCGTKRQATQQSPQEPEKEHTTSNEPTICPNCGSKQTTDAVFCNKCGLKLKRNI